jgi:hypothetical protein
VVIRIIDSEEIEMFKIYALTADRAQLLANTATVDDHETAIVIANLYRSRGHNVRICNESDDIIQEMAA